MCGGAHHHFLDRPVIAFQALRLVPALGCRALELDGAKGKEEEASAQVCGGDTIPRDCCRARGARQRLSDRNGHFPSDINQDLSLVSYGCWFLEQAIVVTGYACKAFSSTRDGAHISIPIHPFYISFFGACQVAWRISTTSCSCPRRVS